MRYSTILFVLFFVLSLANAQGKKYPSRFYLVGEGSAENTGNPADVTAAKERAMGDLANQIQANVNSEFINQVTESAKSLSEYAQSKIKVISKMRIDGAQYEVHKAKDYITVRAILRKDEAADLYAAKTKKLINSLQVQMQRVNQLMQAGENEQALSQLFEASKIFNEVEQNLIVYMILGGMEADALQPKFSRADLDDKIFKLTKKDFHNLDDVLNGLCFQLAKQIKAGAKVTVFPFQFQNTAFGSQLSDYIRQQVYFHLPKFIRFQQGKVDAQGKASGVRITGSYWLHGDQAELLATIFDEKGVTFGSARIKFPTRFLDEAGIAYKPQNFAEAMSEKQYFAKNEVVYGDLKLDFWTNKGAENLIFKEGEQMKLFVRVNTPAYVRFIYHLANGMRTPLIDSYYIDQSKVNKVVEIAAGYDIVCAPPFGVEKLQVFASSEPFPRLNVTTTRIEGEDYTVLADDLQKFLQTTRGFIRKKPQTVKTAERVITITTVARLAPMPTDSIGGK